MDSKDVCCYCGSNTHYSEGYPVHSTFDGKWGHKWCVEKYDEENKPESMKIQENINKLNGEIKHYEYAIDNLSKLKLKAQQKLEQVNEAQEFLNYIKKEIFKDK